MVQKLRVHLYVFKKGIKSFLKLCTLYAVKITYFPEAFSYGLFGLEGGVWVLKYHLHNSANRSQLVSVVIGYFFAVKKYFAFGYLFYAYDTAGEGGFSASALADYADQLTAFYG